MPTKGISVRLDEDLLEWADRYAEERSSPAREVTRTMLLETALSNLREDAESGVPDIRERVREMRRREAEPKPTREDYAASAANRSELFRGLRTPDSIRNYGKPKGGESS